MYSLILCARQSFEFQKWRHLSVSVQKAFAFSNSFSSATAADVSSRDCRKGKNFIVSYLVDSLGLAKKLAESISRRVSFEDNCNPDSILSLFKSYGFTDSQISNIISDYPLLLIADAEKSLGPKLQFLQSKGASSSEFIETVSKVPKILGMKREKAISRYYDFVKEIIEADKSCENSCNSLAEGSQQENRIRNVLVLRELGMPQRLLFSLLISDRHKFCYGKKRFEESLNKVVEMGFDPTSSKFVQALQVFYQMSDKTIEEKVNVYKRLGFDLGDVWEMFKKWPISLTHSEKKITERFETLKKCGLLEDEILSVFKMSPQCINFSEQKVLNSIETFLDLGFTRDEYVMMVKRCPPCSGYSAELVKKKTEFFVKKMNWTLKDVVSNPSGLGYNLQKRIIPRCNVIRALMSKGILRSKPPPMSSVLAITDKAFLNKYVMMHNDKQLVPGLIAIFTGDRVSLTDQKARLEH